ncbi:MAG TPA: hypothetical protein PKD99_14805 [Sphingopyxis sp.]|nr:hypothetical protein [Sphingopyxis sp.]HMP46369.1 hypothetical protein [Sphingopyxis sp.]
MRGMRGRIGGFLALGALAAAGVPQAIAQPSEDLAARNAAYRQADRQLKELEREARLARGGPRTACARFEQLVGSLSESLGPQSILHRETLTALRSRLAAIVNRGCPQGTSRTFVINSETGAIIRDSGPQRPPAPPPPAAAPQPPRTAPDPGPPHPDADDLDAIIDDPDAGLRSQGLAPDDAPPPSPTPPSVDRSSLIGARAAVRVAGERCDPAAYQAAKDRLLGLLDALIAAEPDEERSQALIRERDEVRRLMPPICDPEESILDEIEDARPPRRPRGLPSLQEEAYLPVEFWLGLDETDTPQTGIGVTRDGPSGSAPETDAGLTRDKVRTVGVGGSLGFPLGGTRATVSASYNWGDGGTAFDVAPISGGFNGAVNGALSPSGSSGIGAGSAALAGETRVDLSQFRLRADVTVLEPQPGNRIFFTFDYFREVRSHELSLTGTVSSGGSVIQFDQQRDQRIRDNAFGAGIGGEVRVPLGPALSARIEASAGGYHLNSDLHAIERNTSNFGPAADRDFTIATDEEDSGFGMAAEARVKLEYAVSPRFLIFAGGGASYRSRVGAIFNPNSGDQVFFEGLRTGLRTEDAWSWRLRAGFVVKLGK